MNPENIPLIDACITCISLEAKTAEQSSLQKQCSQILDQIAGLEMLMDPDQLPDSFPEMEL